MYPYKYNRLRGSNCSSHPIPQTCFARSLARTHITSTFLFLNKVSHFILYKNKPSIQNLLPCETRDVFS